MSRQLIALGFLVLAQALPAAPLHDAAAAGDLAELVRLAGQGADLQQLEDFPGGKNGVVGMPIHFAARTGKVEAVKWLLEHGVPRDARLTSSTAPAPGPDVLFVAAAFGQSAVVALLLDRGAPINALHPGGGGGILSAAAQQPPGVSPEAAANTVELLLRRGADVRITPDNQWTPLHGAALAGNARVVELLLKAGADPNLVSEDHPQFGAPPIYRAAMAGNLDVIRVLLAHGAQVNLQDRYGRTALHGAAFEGHAEVVRQLLQAGANPALRDHDRRTAADRARQRGHGDIAGHAGPQVAKGGFGRVGRALIQGCRLGILRQSLVDPVFGLTLGSFVPPITPFSFTQKYW